MATAPDDAPGLLRTRSIELALQGGHLIAARTAVGDPLFLSRRADFAPGKAIRGGVPIIFPWFGDGPPNSGLGAHGFARTAPWREAERSADGQRLVLELVDSAATREQWPHAFRLRLEVAVGAQLELALEVTNTGLDAFEYEVALHSYFAVEDATRVLVHGLEGATYVDKTAGFAERRQGSEPIHFAAEVDRVYAGHEGPVRIEDPLAARTIRVRKSGSRSTIVWNPGPQRARSMSDLGDDWSRFVCVESGNVGSDRRVLESGGSDRLEVRVAIG